MRNLCRLDNLMTGEVAAGWLAVVMLMLMVNNQGVDVLAAAGRTSLTRLPNSIATTGVTVDKTILQPNGRQDRRDQCGLPDTARSSVCASANTCREGAEMNHSRERDWTHFAKNKTDGAIIIAMLMIPLLRHPSRVHREPAGGRLSSKLPAATSWTQSMVCNSSLVVIVVVVALLPTEELEQRKLHFAT